MFNFFCAGSRVFKISYQRSNFKKKCQAVVLFGCLNGSLTYWGIPTQVGQLNPESRQGRALSADPINEIAPTEPERININHASVKELQALPGIGIVTAKRIVEYRKNNPPFRKVEELLIIRGISRNRLEQIRNRITVN